MSKSFQERDRERSAKQARRNVRRSVNQMLARIPLDADQIAVEENIDRIVHDEPQKDR
jgi:hypothetical protein